jgi:MFS family permease
LPGIRLALIVGVVLMIFQQINGVNMILMYTPTILIEAGIGSPSNALLNSLYVNAYIFVCTLVAFWLVGRFGRRPILMVGVAAMATGHLLLGLAFMLELPLYFVMTSMLICTAAFTLSLAPLGWVVVAEIYPNRIRAKALSVVCFFLYGSSFICTQVFPMITSWFQTTFGNQGGAYWIFAGICFSCVLFCWRVIPETKDLTLEEISQFWLQHDKKATTSK